MEHVRVCRDCGEEYRPGIERCADCGGVLEDRFGDAAAAYRRRTGEREREPPPPPRPEGYATLHTTRSAAEAVSLARLLEEAGVPFHLGQEAGEDPGTALLVLSVPPEERARADAALGQETPPDLEAGFDPDHGYARCPACGAAASRGRTECAECGLALGGPPGGEDEEER